MGTTVVSCCSWRVIEAMSRFSGFVHLIGGERVCTKFSTRLQY
jgi:hypothetical protein